MAEPEPEPGAGGPPPAKKGKGLGNLKGDPGEKKRAYISIAVGILGAILAFVLYKKQQATAAANAAAASPTPAAGGAYTYPSEGSSNGDVAGDTSAGGTSTTGTSSTAPATSSTTLPVGSNVGTPGIGEVSTGGSPAQVGATPPPIPSYASPSQGQIPYTATQLGAVQSIGSAYGATAASQGTNAYGMGVIDYTLPTGSQMEVQSQALPKALSPGVTETVGVGKAGPTITVH